jgi:thymidylate synthase (FAD)
MIKILPYSSLEVEMLRCTSDPGALIHLAASHCMKNPEYLDSEEYVQERAQHEARGLPLVKYLISAEHTSPLEHVYFTFKIRNFSRSGLLQLTRHRMASYTVSSQHYQDYQDYPFIVHPLYVGNPHMQRAIRVAQECYEAMLEDGVPKEEARQVLNNASACGFVMSINARSLLNFIRLRRCRRNCVEIRLLAERIHLLANEFCGSIFSYVHAPCAMDGKCNQGVMSCGKPYPKIELG